MAINPADSPLFGTLYGSDAMRAVFDEGALLARMLQTEAALARAQARCGVIPETAAHAIAAAARPEILDQGELAASIRRVGYPVVGLVRALSQAAGEEAGRWTHWGATTQDITDTALVLQIRAGLDLIHADLERVVSALADLAARHCQTVMAGRTHLQHAAPITFGLKCAVWLLPLLAHRERLGQLRPRVERVQLGGAVGTLAALGANGLAVQAAFAEELGLAVPLAPWHVARDGVAEAVSWLGLLCGSLAKIATDVILLTQTEVAEVAEPHAEGRGASSTMPQKRNPIAAEYILAAARGVQALVPLMQGAMADDHERGTGPWQAEALALPQSFVLTHGALQHARAVAEGLQVDVARMRHNLDASSGLIMSEAVMMGLAPVLGRATAHHVVQQACDRALNERISLAAALAGDARARNELTPARIDALVDPVRYLGAAQQIVERVLAVARDATRPPA
jgi:3-carboxy-cis,cis-muconate cycloisomerase